MQILMYKIIWLILPQIEKKEKALPIEAPSCLDKMLFSERPVHTSTAGVALTLALPARDVQVIREVIVLRCEAVAYFEHSASAAQ